MTPILPLALALGFALLLERKRPPGPASRLDVSKMGASIAFGMVLAVLEHELGGRWDCVPLAAGALFWLLPRPGSSAPAASPPDRFLASRWAPVLAGVVTAISVWWIWGSLTAIPVSHDEAAYLLQARIFSTGHWTAPGRPLPEFFEQTHVFVTPFLASKYPPGHSLALVPGVWLGFPGLGPVVLNGIGALFLFLLARRLAGPSVALLTWLLWLTAPGDLVARASYLSETTSTALWLAGWWALLKWRETNRSGYLLGLAALTGWEFLTRPLTMLAFSIPVGLVVLRQVAMRRSWRPFFSAMAIGAVILAILPLWSWQTLGTWRTTPYRRYSTVYYPYQWSGFHFDATPPLRPHPPEMAAFDRFFRRVQREHRVSDLPEIFRRRVAAIAEDVWGGGRRFLVAFAALGTVGARAPEVFGLASALVLILVYLVYAHSPAWSVYYVEMHAVLAFLTALGLQNALAGLASRIPPVPVRSRSLLLQWGVLATSVGLVIVPSISELGLARRTVRERSGDQAIFRDALTALPDRKAVVFVRHSPEHDPHRELISNSADLAVAKVWIVYDRGGRNGELLRLAPERVPYVYDEARRRLTPLDRAGG